MVFRWCLHYPNLSSAGGISEIHEVEMRDYTEQLVEWIDWISPNSLLKTIALILSLLRVLFRLFILPFCQWVLVFSNVNKRTSLHMYDPWFSSLHYLSTLNERNYCCDFYLVTVCCPCVDAWCFIFVFATVLSSSLFKQSRCTIAKTCGLMKFKEQNNLMFD